MTLVGSLPCSTQVTLEVSQSTRLGLVPLTVIHSRQHEQSGKRIARDPPFDCLGRVAFTIHWTTIQFINDGNLPLLNSLLDRDH